MDTSAFVALEDRSDRLHAPARSFYESLTPADRLCTSNYVVDETVTRLRYTVGWQAAVDFAEAVLKSRLCGVVYVDADVERAALQVLKRFKDKRLSFTDCTSMALLARLRLDAVFAFDEDFARAGFRTLPN
ncbi:MAG: PIN domain-containing protein [Elusimicrobia bacterium]|nr:PIN domain-containing protein [Elusimicrobiota bacterium]